jgi:penicillin-binding protein 1A
MKKTLNKIFSFLLFTTFIIFLTLGSYIFFVTKDLHLEASQEISTPLSSKIYDDSTNVVEDFATLTQEYIPYSSIPSLLVDALLSIEDKDFFNHKGINGKRIIASFIANLKNSASQGGSTITQQLAKNLFLSTKKTYLRKIKEAYLAKLLEKTYTKEEILELYFNHIYFEQSIKGIAYASKFFFSKEVSLLNLPEMAMLVGLVKSPSYYYPLTHPENAYKRKNEVLQAMYTNRLISEYEMEISKAITIEELLNINKNEQTYVNQAYLDIVYQEVKDLTSLDIYETPLKVETYLDTTAQLYCDQIQENKIVPIDDLLQIGGALLDKRGKIVALIGGKDYYGKKLYSRAYQMKRNPASCIKPIFTYLLALEYLSYHSLTTLSDEQVYYPQTFIKVNNADDTYLGNLSLIEAIGYSRNTCVISTQEKLERQLGKDFFHTYLTNIQLMDEGTYSYSYALGGFTSGVTPISLASSYNMLRNNGKYITPTTIKRITRMDNNQVIYQDNYQEKQIISPSSCSQMNDILEKVIDNNYLQIGLAKIDDISICGKTGTGNYSSSTIQEYHYPSYADKDVWFCGYSPSYTLSVWTGFDKPLLNENAYFGKNDSKRKTAKKIFKAIMEKLPHQKSFTLDENLISIDVIKYMEQNYLPNSYIPKNYIATTLLKKEDEYQEVIPLSFNLLNNINYFYNDHLIYISVLNPLTEDSIYTIFYGNRCYYVTIITPLNEETLIAQESSEFIYQFETKGTYQFSIYESFKNNNTFKGETYCFEVTL